MKRIPKHEVYRRAFIKREKQMEKGLRKKCPYLDKDPDPWEPGTYFLRCKRYWNERVKRYHEPDYYLCTIECVPTEECKNCLKDKPQFLKLPSLPRCRQGDFR